MRIETKVGLFVVVGLISLFVLSTRVQTIANFGKNGYIIYANVPTAVGLETNSAVRINGVEAGFIKSMQSKRNSVRLELFIFSGNEIAKDSQLIVTKESLLGGKYINIVYGDDDEILENGATISSYQIRADMDEAIDEFKQFITNINQTFDKDTKKNIQEAIAEFKQVAKEFKLICSTLNERLPKIMAQIDSLTAEFDQTGKTINSKLPEILGKFAKIEDEIDEILQENKEPLNSALTSVDGFFSKGEKTLDSLEGILGKVEKAELQVDLDYKAMLNDGFGSGRFGVAYLPNPTNYYMLALDTAPNLDKLDPITNKPIGFNKHEKGRYLISAQAGKRYNDWLFRAGIFQNTGGVGVDWFNRSDRIKLSLEAFDFNAENDIRGDNAHLKATARWLPWKNIAVYGGYDNFINADASNFFVGAGVHFVDDDLKYLMMNLGGAAK